MVISVLQIAYSSSMAMQIIVRIHIAENKNIHMRDQTRYTDLQDMEDEKSDFERYIS